jgi:cobalamin biosynthesis protein CobC
MEGGKGVSSDHGGGVDEAIRLWGGSRADWLDLSTGINPEPYPYQGLTRGDWTDLPDSRGFLDLEEAARQFWQIPAEAKIVATPGLSSVIAILPYVLMGRSYSLMEPVYNEYGRAFAAAGRPKGRDVRIIVRPNNPDGRLDDIGDAVETIIDESFCDTMPEASLIAQATTPGTLILKSFGKFWGLAGLRLGFAIGDPTLVERIRLMTGPWAVSGPALKIGARALTDIAWAQTTRQRLTQDAARLDQMFTAKGAKLVGGTPLFRLYDTDNAGSWQHQLAEAKILTRVFPYSDTWLRVGLPPAQGWQRLEAAL